MLRNRDGSKFSIRRLWAWEGEAGGAGGDTGGAGGTGGATTTVVPQTSSSVESSVPTGGGGQAPASTSSWADKIPADYRSKPYMENILKSANPETEFFKQFDGLQTKLGQRVGAPAPDASDEDWNKYYETVRPADANQYEFKPVDLGEEGKAVADFINNQRDDEFMGKVKGIFHKHGLTKKQADGVAADYDQILSESIAPAIKQQLDAKKQMEADFDTQAKARFGENVDNALARGRKFVEDFLPKDMRASLGGLPNEALIAFAVAADEVHKKYEKGDTVVPAGGAQTAQTVQEMRDELRRLMTAPEASKFHPEYESNQKERTRVAKEIARLEQEARQKK